MNLSKGYLLALVAFFGVLSALLILPFLQFLLLAVLVAYVLTPLQRRLEGRVGDRLAAFSMVGLAIACVFAPLGIVVVAIAGDAMALAARIEAEGLGLGTIEEWIEQRTGFDVTLADLAEEPGQEVGTFVLEQFTGLFTGLIHVSIGLLLTVFLLYYFLKDGDRFNAWLHETTPLPEPVQTDLYETIDEVMWAALFGHVLIAIVQGVVAGLGLFATGIPNATFWTFVMVILAILPLIGAFLVWGPASAYLVLTGEPLLGVALFLWGATVVTISDDYLRPIVVDRHADLNPGVIVFGVLGGIYAFGVMGLFFGPVVLGGLKASLTVLSEHWDQLEQQSPR